jgi:hypothetical protein
MAYVDLNPIRAKIEKHQKPQPIPASKNVPWQWRTNSASPKHSCPLWVVTGKIFPRYYLSSQRLLWAGRPHRPLHSWTRSGVYWEQPMSNSAATSFVCRTMTHSQHRVWKTLLLCRRRRVDNDYIQNSHPPQMTARDGQGKSPTQPV